MTVCGVTVCPFSRHKGNQRPKHEIALSVTRQTCTWDCPGHGEGASRATQIKNGTSAGPFPRGGGGFTENPHRGSPKRGRGGRGRGGGGVLVVGNLGSARGPFTVKKKTLFDEKRFKSSRSSGSLTLSQRTP